MLILLTAISMAFAQVTPRDATCVQEPYVDKALLQQTQSITSAFELDGKCTDFQAVTIPNEATSDDGLSLHDWKNSTAFYINRNLTLNYEIRGNPNVYLLETPRDADSYFKENYAIVRVDERDAAGNPTKITNLVLRSKGNKTPVFSRAADVLCSYNPTCGTRLAAFNKNQETALVHQTFSSRAANILNEKIQTGAPATLSSDTKANKANGSILKNVQTSVATALASFKGKTTAELIKATQDAAAAAVKPLCASCAEESLKNFWPLIEAQKEKRDHATSEQERLAATAEIDRLMQTREIFMSFFNYANRFAEDAYTVAAREACRGPNVMVSLKAHCDARNAYEDAISCMKPDALRVFDASLMGSPESSLLKPYTPKPRPDWLNSDK